MEHLCCVAPVPRCDTEALHFWGLRTRLNGDSEVSSVPESDPLVDVGFNFFPIDEGAEYPHGDDNPFPNDLSLPQAMRGLTWGGPGKV